ncbi:MAG: U32 family peptidase C-terminal domain-containing protein [Planctomycetota bacterium]|jgi:putative protease
MQIPELLIPAGNLLKLRVALAYGADAVYVGAARFSMRPDEAAMTPEVLAEAVEHTHNAGKRIYVGLNTLMGEADIGELEAWLAETGHIPFDAVIVSDPGVLALVRAARSDVEVHISTQLSTANHHAAQFWMDAGASRVVLARECTIEDAGAIAAANIPVEVFVHGAMCIAYSGRCLLSAHLTGKSGNRGECKHSCRWEWQLVESKRPGDTLPVFETGKETILLGSTDLCLIEHIPELVQSGMASLKVEGRMKGEYYVGVITRTYRAALDAYAAAPEGFTLDPAWTAELESVSHRPYDTGFAFGYPEQEPERLQVNNTVSGTYDVVGLVTGLDGDTLQLLVKNPFRVDETLKWVGPDNSAGTLTVASILGPDRRPRDAAHPGTTVTVTLTDSPPPPELALLRRRSE